MSAPPCGQLSTAVDNKLYSLGTTLPEILNEHLRKTEKAFESNQDNTEQEGMVEELSSDRGGGRETIQNTNTTSDGRDTLEEQGGARSEVVMLTSNEKCAYPRPIR